MAESSSNAKTVPIVIVTALITLIGTLSTPLVSMLTASQTAKANVVKYCQARVDVDQALLRTKGEAFLVSIGHFRAKLLDPMDSKNYEKKHPELVAEALPIADSAWRLGAYADSKLGRAGIALSKNIETLLYGKEEERSVAFNSFDGFVDKWMELFHDSDRFFEKRRVACISDVSPEES
ncbi:MAG: hypothetical protein ACQZ2J_27510 [Pseudomonas piscis]|uniref:hypothetical protein n=1 Tax=Pseudomonas piscis TaxID=2614538 RepID=UPI003D2D7F5D